MSKSQSPPLAVVILAAGQGTRMRSKLPKVLHKVGGRPMLDWAIAAAQGAGAERIVVVVGPHSPDVAAHVQAQLGPNAIAVQMEALGTAHAVRAAEDALRGFEGDVCVVYADTPRISAHNLLALRAARDQAHAVLLAFTAADPTGYGRLVFGSDGRLARVVEENDATPAERALKLCNSGVILAPSALLWPLLSRIGNTNAKGEYYLTDLVALLHAEGVRVENVAVGEHEVLGVNSREQLAQAEAAFQHAARMQAMAGGVTLIDPATVFFSYDTVLGQDVVVEPGVWFGPGVRVGPGARIRAFSHLEGAVIGPACEVGPFARLRPGAELEEQAKVGNFVELKNTRLGRGAKASHLSYLGDAEIGADANIGAGVITCNYDGFFKYRTEIGDGAFIGSNSALVAPLRVGVRSYIASGSVVTGDVPDDALAVARVRQINKPDWSKRFRQQASARKARKAAEGA